MRNKMTALVLAAAMLLGITLGAQPVSASMESRIKEEKSELEAQLNDIRTEVKSLEDKNQALNRRLQELQQQGKTMASEYEQLTDEMNLASDVMQAAVEESEKAIEEVKIQQKAYEDRIVVLFQYQNKSTLEVLLESENLGGFFTNMRLLEYVADADNQLLTNLKMAQEVAEQKKQNAEQTVVEYNDFIDQKQEQLEGLSNGISLVEMDIRSVDSEILTRNSEAGEVQDMITEVDSRLAAFYEQMKREAEEAKRREEEARAAAAAESRRASESESRSIATAEESSREAAASVSASVRRQEEEAASRAVEASRKAEEASRKAAEAASRASANPDDVSLSIKASKDQEEAASASAAATTAAPVTTTTTTRVTTTTTTAPPVQQPANGRLIMPLTSYHYMSSPYGYRTHPITGARMSFHYGVDWSANAGTPVRAAKGGTVCIANKPYQGMVYTSHKSGYGNYVTINHGDGTATTYAHLSYVDCYEGQTVSAGERIGRVGSTGASTGPHLHFEYAINGSTVNPLDYID
jgi:murein DD-endopeptidase MepM/ murein hydrolase activator NlpD